MGSARPRRLRTAALSAPRVETSATPARNGTNGRKSLCDTICQATIGRVQGTMLGALPNAWIRPATILSLRSRSSPTVTVAGSQEIASG